MSSWNNKKSNFTIDAKPVGGSRNTSASIFSNTKPLFKALPDITKPSTITSSSLSTKTPNSSARSAFFATKTTGSSQSSSKAASSSSWRTNTTNTVTNSSSSSNSIFKSSYTSNTSNTTNFSSTVTKSIFTTKNNNNNNSSINSTQQQQGLVKLSPFNREFPDEPKYVTTQTYVSPYRGTYRTPYSSSLLKTNDQKIEPPKPKLPPTVSSGFATKNVLGAGAMLMLGSNSVAKNNMKPLDTRPTSLYDVNVKSPKTAVKPVLSTSQSHSELPANSNSKAHRGYIIIFNHEEFKDRKMNREGSRRDEEALCQTFYHFGFEPNVKRNLKFSDIQSKVKALSTKNFKNYGCFVAVILSHGTADETIFAYDKTFHLNRDIINPISTNSTLVGKPKIFIIATCRGDQQELFLPKSMNKMETDSVPFMDRSSSVPYYRDILKCYSTYEGFVSYRNPQKGTVFIQTFCDILNKKGLTSSVEDVIKEVNKALTEGDNINKQVPTVVSTMSTNFCFGSLKR